MAPLLWPQVAAVEVAVGTGGLVLLATLNVAFVVQLPPAETVTV